MRMRTTVICRLRSDETFAASLAARLDSWQYVGAEAVQCIELEMAACCCVFFVTLPAHMLLGAAPSFLQTTVRQRGMRARDREWRVHVRDVYEMRRLLRRVCKWTTGVVRSVRVGEHWTVRGRVGVCGSRARDSTWDVRVDPHSADY